MSLLEDTESDWSPLKWSLGHWVCEREHSIRGPQINPLQWWHAGPLVGVCVCVCVWASHAACTLFSLMSFIMTCLSLYVKTQYDSYSSYCTCIIIKNTQIFLYMWCYYIGKDLLNINYTCCNAPSTFLNIIIYIFK